VMTNKNTKTSSSSSSSNDALASKSANDSFIMIDARSSSSENVAMASMTTIPVDSSERHVAGKGSAIPQPKHFTFEESKLLTDAQNLKHHREFAQGEPNSTHTTTNNHLPLVTSAVPTGNRSRSPTITTSRRGGRSSPLTSSIRSSPPPPTNRSTPVNFSASSVKDHLQHSLPSPSARGPRQSKLPSTNFNHEKHRRYTDAPSSVAAAAAAAAAATAAASSGGRYYIGMYT
jgi:hypothetical protein